MAPGLAESLPRRPGAARRPTGPQYDSLAGKSGKSSTRCCRPCGANCSRRSAGARGPLGAPSRGGVDRERPGARSPAGTRRSSLGGADRHGELDRQAAGDSSADRAELVDAAIVADVVAREADPAQGRDALLVAGRRVDRPAGRLGQGNLGGRYLGRGMGCLGLTRIDLEMNVRPAARVARREDARERRDAVRPRRRSRIVSMSNGRPWSKTGSVGSGRGRPSTVGTSRAAVMEGGTVISFDSAGQVPRTVPGAAEKRLRAGLLRTPARRPRSRRGPARPG